jgi:hypothetical protein
VPGALILNIICPQITQIFTDKTTHSTSMPLSLLGGESRVIELMKICVNLCNLRVEQRF